MREHGLRDSQRVVDIWETLLFRDATLCNEKWIIMEQVFIAALDVGDDHLARDCLGQLRTHFKKSSRINRLFGMYLEATGRFEDAQSVYEQLLMDDPTNTFVCKRKIAILKAQRRTVDAIDGLRNYLKTFMSDFEAWNELADLYLAEGDFKHAAFCLEEILLSSPHNHLYCQRYAEVKYTEGGVENLEIARAYYSQACQLSPRSLRSLYGLLLTCSALNQQSGKLMLGSVFASHLTSTNEKHNPAGSSNGSHDSGIGIRSSMKIPLGSTGLEVNRQLMVWALSKIRKLYENALIKPHSLVSFKNTLHKVHFSSAPKPSARNPSLSINSDTNIAAEDDTSLSHTRQSLHHVGSQTVALVSDSRHSFH